LCGADVVGREDAAEMAVAKTEDRLGVRALLAGRFLALPAVVPGAVERIEQIGPAAQHLVVNGGGADDARVTPGLCLAHAQEAHDVAAVGMERELAGGLGAPAQRDAEILPLVLDGAEQLAPAPLR